MQSLILRSRPSRRFRGAGHMSSTAGPTSAPISWFLGGFPVDSVFPHAPRRKALGLLPLPLSRCQRFDVSGSLKRTRVARQASPAEPRATASAETKPPPSSGASTRRSRALTSAPGSLAGGRPRAEPSRGKKSGRRRGRARCACAPSRERAARFESGGAYDVQ